MGRANEQNRWRWCLSIDYLHSSLSRLIFALKSCAMEFSEFKLVIAMQKFIEDFFVIYNFCINLANDL